MVNEGEAGAFGRSSPSDYFIQQYWKHLMRPRGQDHRYFGGLFDAQRDADSDDPYD